MKRVSKMVKRNLPLLKLYLDDIERLVATLAENGVPPTIHADDYEFDSVQDLLNLNKKQVSELRIGRKKPTVEVWLSRGFAVITAYDDSASTVGIVQKCYDELKSASNIMSRALNIFGWISVCVVPVLTVSVLETLWSSSYTVAIILGGNLIVCGALLYWGNRRLTKSYCLINTARRSETPSFWKRQGDNIIVNLLVAIVATVISVVATIYFTK